MTNIIVTEPSGNLRALGRETLAGKWGAACIVVLIYEICTTLPPMLLNVVFGQDLLGQAISYWSGSYWQPSFEVPYTPLSNLYILLVEGPFLLGLTIFFLRLFRKQGEDIAQIFAGFEQFIKALGLFFMVGLFTFLWTLLFIVPGIIAAYRYSQVFFILADNPELPIMECIYRSKMMMMGNKGKLFCMHLTFIGWAILAVLPVTILQMIMDNFYTPGFIYHIVTFVAGLGEVVVMAYIYATSTAFYDILTGRLRASNYMPGQY